MTHTNQTGDTKMKKITSSIEKEIEKEIEKILNCENLGKPKKRRSIIAM